MESLVVALWCAFQKMFPGLWITGVKNQHLYNYAFWAVLTGELYRFFLSIGRLNVLRQSTHLTCISKQVHQVTTITKQRKKTLQATTIANIHSKTGIQQQTPYWYFWIEGSYRQNCYKVFLSRIFYKMLDTNKAHQKPLKRHRRKTTILHRKPLKTAGKQ